jgi:hypothetical protein
VHLAEQSLETLAMRLGVPHLLHRTRPPCMRSSFHCTRLLTDLALDFTAGVDRGPRVLLSQSGGQNKELKAAHNIRGEEGARPILKYL